MSCGLYMKCTPSMMPGQHSCNLSKESIKKNLNECLAILGTLCEAENGDYEKDLKFQAQLLNSLISSQLPRT